MKINKIAIILTSVIAMSCTGDFEDMNKDPMAVSEVSPKLILPVMMNSGYHLVAGDYQRATTLYSALYCQYFANTANYFTSDSYMFNTAWAERGLWSAYYGNVIRGMREVAASLENHPEYTDMYQIMRINTAIMTIRMTDIFGDIPYTKAGYGETQNPYDAQKDIYYDVFNELTDAVAILKEARQNQLQYGDEDMIYQGNVEKWIKLANSVRLRAALRISFIDPNKAKAEGEAALKESLIASNEDNAAVTIPMPNTWYNLLIEAGGWNEFRASKTLVNILQQQSSVTDPRLELMLSQTEAYVKGEDRTVPRFQGVPNGLSTADVSLKQYNNEHNSGIWGYMWGFKWNSLAPDPTASLPNTHEVCPPLSVMNYSEVCFLKAEAALRNWAGAGNAKDNYENGIKASFADMRTLAPEGSYTSDNDNTYITTGNVKWNETDDFETKLEKIITQKWLGIYPNADEAWAECRRTGYPILNPVVLSLDPNINPANGEFIKKLRYVDNELTNNKENAENPALNGGKGDGLNVRVWWDTARYK